MFSFPTARPTVCIWMMVVFHFIEYSGGQVPKYISMMAMQTDVQLKMVWNKIKERSIIVWVNFTKRMTSFFLIVPTSKNWQTSVKTCKTVAVLPIMSKVMLMCWSLPGGRPGLIFPYVWKYQPSYCYFKPYGNFNKDFNKIWTMSLFELWQCQVVLYHEFLVAIVFRGIIHSI